MGSFMCCYAQANNNIKINGYKKNRFSPLSQEHLLRGTVSSFFRIAILLIKGLHVHGWLEHALGFPFFIDLSISLYDIFAGRGFMLMIFNGLFFESLIVMISPFSPQISPLIQHFSLS